ncbi:hypothetical protein [Thalassoglobus polymorphus]|uniref:Uncharacterized protein n=1 Tax=Thalassoglobus polymorphus TaxID=2527994 RepID=A0A517QHT7_9PLAN|nr:hypothetical protein [Thalassoglobus polymorphus]QDT31191.1 hypothetical protein Mal48_04230 [Thalassoglobus polymorphus]
MFSPYEELEYLSDYLPEEGEAVLVVRESGELICKPWSQDDLREGIHDSQLYGMLVQANERLNSVGTMPLWVAGIALVWLAIVVHGLLGVGWDRWYLIPGCSIPVLYGALYWMKKRQQAYFQNAILPMLQTELRNRQTPFYSLLAGIRQHEEFRCLLDEIVHWSPLNSEL